MADDDDFCLRAVMLKKVVGCLVGCGPDVEDSQGPGRGPNFVEEGAGLSPESGAGFRLADLHLGGDAFVDVEEGFEILELLGGMLGVDAVHGFEGGVVELAPGGDAGEDDVAVGDENFSAIEIDSVMIGGVRVVIAGGEYGGGSEIGAKGFYLAEHLAAFLDEAAGALFGGVAVKDDGGGPIDERCELRDVVDPAAGMAEVEIGQDADGLGESWGGDGAGVGHVRRP